MEGVPNPWTFLGAGRWKETCSRGVRMEPGPLTGVLGTLLAALPSAGSAHLRAQPLREAAALQEQPRG